uniref:Uncharacterized protein n=1 Tax=viral metagenome TaxID=1070528 RepID=A0A6M3X4X9_9ZZZZ
MGALNQALKALHMNEMRYIHRQGVNATDLGTGLDYNIFNVEGDVQVHMMFGQVTTVIGGTANLIFLNFTSLVPAATVALCAVTAGAINADAVNTLYVWDGTIAGALTPANNIGHSGSDLIPWAGNTILLSPGIIGVDVGAAGANTGEIDWYILFTPCFPGADITIL